MKDKYNGCYIDNYKDHYAIFSKDGKVLGEYDSHKEAKEDLPEYESMNEGVLGAITVAIGAIGVACCLIQGAIDKRHAKDVKKNLAPEEFNAIKKDTLAVAKALIAAQKSSSYYNMIYKFNAITQDSHKDLVYNFNNGNIYSCTIKFFDAENYEIYKSYLKEYGDWGSSNSDWEKLEKVVNDDMIKIIKSLGFDIKTGKSSKYPNCELRVADGEVIYIIPKMPDDILERGKKKGKKLNEDHSEISNDPEMEQLMALAGITTEDLDELEDDDDLELDDDDPIDVNTMCEIDATMDESFFRN